MRCDNCNIEKEVYEIKNYVVHYESWDAFNCCSKGCAKKSAIKNGIEEHEIINIE